MLRVKQLSKHNKHLRKKQQQLQWLKVNQTVLNLELFHSKEDNLRKVIKK
jgi:hypothetical protein